MSGRASRTRHRAVRVGAFRDRTAGQEPDEGAHSLPCAGRLPSKLCSLDSRSMLCEEAISQMGAEAEWRPETGGREGELVCSPCQLRARCCPAISLRTRTLYPGARSALVKFCPMFCTQFSDVPVAAQTRRAASFAGSLPSPHSLALPFTLCSVWRGHARL